MRYKENTSVFQDLYDEYLGPGGYFKVGLFIAGSFIVLSSAVVVGAAKKLLLE